MSLEQDDEFLKSPSLHTQTEQNFVKSCEKAVEFRKRAMKSAATANGNVVAESKIKIEHAMRLSNMITAFAADERDLAMGHLTRYQIQKEICPEESMKHLALALANGVQPTNFKGKEVELDSDSDSDFCAKFTKILQIHSKTETQQDKNLKENQKKIKRKQEEFIESMLSLKSANPIVPALEDFVEIKWSQQRGRHLVTSKDVSIGTVLCVEKPMDFGLFGLTDIFSLEINRCYHCLRKIVEPTPCPNCVFVLFCSEKCLKSSFQYHQFECSCFPDFCKVVSQHPEEKRWVFSFQLLCKLGPKKLHDIFKDDENPEPESILECPKNSTLGFEPHTQKYTMGSYHTLRQMTLSFAPVDPSAPYLTQTLVKILEEKTTFFENLATEKTGNSTDFEKSKSNFQNFIRNCLILHTRLNCIFLKEKVAKNVMRESEYGAVLCPTVKLCNHSCDPNVIGHGPTSDWTWALIAARDLKKGEELTRTYGPRFELCEKLQRKAQLKTGFNFECECHACVFDWPALSLKFSSGNFSGDERKKFMIWTCPTCSNSKGLRMSQSEKAREENRLKITLTRDGAQLSRLKCPSCELSFSEVNLLTQLAQKLEILSKCEGLINQCKNESSGKTVDFDGNPVAILKEIKDVCTFLQSHLLPPSYYQIHAEKLFRKSLDAFLWYTTNE